MRLITGLGAAVLALTVGGPWMTSVAQAPGGSYQETCKDVSVRGSTLYARCKDTGNQYRDTELRDFDRCRNEIQNINGELSCTGQGGGYAYNQNRDRDYDHDRDRDRDRDHDRDFGHDRDRDSYRQTCQNIHRDGDRLKAKCQKANGGWRNTSLDDADRCPNIVNEDGHLRCR
ncbi:MAG TPA: hypothetical protein VIB39_00365 [Candidatus Angelobacter sp.]